MKFYRENTITCGILCRVRKCCGQDIALWEKGKYYILFETELTFVS